MWVELFLVKFAAALAPGPNCATVAGASACGGPMAGGAAALGVLAAETVWSGLACAMASGAVSLIEPPRFLLDALAAAALLWLGARLLRPASPAAPARFGRIGHGGVGLAVGLSNPLVLIFYVGVFPRIVERGDASALSSVACVAVVVAATALALSAYVLAPLIAGRAKAGRLMPVTAGCLLCGLGLSKAVMLAQAGFI
jgi:threonine/homoserine/homoserine lactone efflux protein